MPGTLSGSLQKITNPTPEEIARFAEILAIMFIERISQQQLAYPLHSRTPSSSSVSECSRCYTHRSATILRPIAVRPSAPAVVEQTNSDGGESSPGLSSSLDGQFLDEYEIQDINTWVDETGVTKDLRYADLVRTRAGITDVPNHLTQRRATVANNPTNLMQIRLMQTKIGNKKIKHSK